MIQKSHLLIFIWSKHNTNSRRCTRASAHCSDTYSNQDMEANCEPISRWTGKADVRAYVCMQNITQPWKRALATWDSIDGPRGHDAKWTKSEKDRKYRVILLIRGI